MSTEKQGNPNDVFGSDDSFFDNLESNVNGMVSETETPVEATPTQDPNNTVNTEQVSQETSENENLKKRYSDSSREAQKLRAELNELKPFVPVLNAMKKDSGLVEHVRNYFQEGGEVPGNIKEKLKLDEEFELDNEELVNNPDSDSRKVFNAMVDNVVKKRADEILHREDAKNQEMQFKINAKEEAIKFMKEHNMNEETFLQFVNQAKDRFEGKRLSFNDMYYLANRGKTAANVANATKQDMLSQMRNVRNIPTSQSGTNNAGDKSASPSDSLFDALLDVDGNLDNMFG